MKLKTHVLGSVSAIVLGLYPLQASAQIIDTADARYERDMIRIKVAAAYTEVLRQVREELAVFLIGQPRFLERVMGLSEPSQQDAFIIGLAETIAATGRPPERGSAGALPFFDYDKMESFDIRFRFCDGKLLAYFDTDEFKSNLSERDILMAPMWLANTQVRSDYPSLRMITDATGERRLVDNRRVDTRYPQCFDSLAGAPAPLASETLVDWGIATSKDRAVRSRPIGYEYREEACPDGQVGAGIKWRRTLMQPVSYQGLPVGEPVPDDLWEVFGNFCRPAQLTLYDQTVRCSQGGTRAYRGWLMEVQDPADPKGVLYVPSDRDGNILAEPVLQRLITAGNCSEAANPTMTLAPSSDTSQQEQRALACNAVYSGSGTIGGDYIESRTHRRKIYSITEPVAYTITQSSYTNWAAVTNTCFNYTAPVWTQSRSLGCPSGWSGEHIQARQLRERHWDYFNPAHADRHITEEVTGWYSTSYTCQAPPPAPDWSVGGGGHAGGSSSGDGNGMGDFGGAGNGSSGGGGDGGGGDGKIVCTAMNAAYGFGSYRQAIWLSYARQHMSKYHQTGYHLLALPLIRFAYGADHTGARALRSAIEHMARERTADIRAEMRGGKRRKLGRVYRAVLEPLCFGIGRMAGGREVMEIRDVPVIAARLRDI